MSTENPASKIRRIANKLLAFSRREEKTLSVRMSDGSIKFVPIRGVRIIIDECTEEFDEPIEHSYRKIASPIVPPIPKAGKTYSLEQVKEFVENDRVNFENRPDGKADLARINMSKLEAKHVISQLTDSNYSKSYDKIPEDPHCQFPVDIYKVKNYHRVKDNVPMDLYIKFYINYIKEVVGIVSFHGKEKKRW